MLEEKIKELEEIQQILMQGNVDLQQAVELLEKASKLKEQIEEELERIKTIINRLDPGSDLNPTNQSSSVDTESDAG